MNNAASLSELLATVTRALSEDVLPQVESGWAAGNLRACIMVLTHLQDRAELERDTLIADTLDMRALLLSAQDGGVALDADLQSLFAALPDRIETPTAQLRHENTVCREAVTQLVRSLAAAGDSGPLRQELRACLSRMQDRELAMLRRAETVPPI